MSLFSQRQNNFSLGGRRVPLEDRGGRQARERTGRLDDMPYADPPMMEELDDRIKLAGRVGRHTNRSPMTNVPFELWGEVPDSSQRIAPPLEAYADGWPEQQRPDAIENADWLIREANMINMPAGYLEVDRRERQKLGDYRNTADTWYGGYPELTMAPIAPQIELPIIMNHESDNYAAEVNHDAGVDRETSTASVMLAGIDWDSSFAESRGNRGAAYTEWTNQVRHAAGPGDRHWRRAAADVHFRLARRLHQPDAGALERARRRRRDVVHAAALVDEAQEHVCPLWPERRARAAPPHPRRRRAARRESPVLQYRHGLPHGSRQSPR